MSFPPQVPYARAVTVALFLAALVGTAATVSAQGVPGTDANKCLAGKTKCVNKKIAGLLKCRAKCQGNPAACGQPETDCEAKVMAKFDGGPDPTKGCFAKLEAKADPSKPESVCLTTGDSGTIETQVDLLVGVLLANLEPPPPPPPCAGATTGGFCWFLGALGADCDQTCTAAGRAYDDIGTRTFAGSSGTNTNCQNVMTDLGVVITVFTAGNWIGAGCVDHPDPLGDAVTRDTSPTTSTASNATIRRACACQ